MNILILSVGTRNKIVRYFKDNVDGKVFTTDMQKIAPAIYESDKYFIVPKISDSHYVGEILKICRDEKIDGVLSLNDNELSIIAANEKRFNEIGTKVIGSSYDLCEMAIDKMRMFKWLSEHGYRCAKSYDSLDEFEKDFRCGLIGFPVFVKPINGSASIDARRVDDLETLEFIWNHSGEPMMVQEYLSGDEIGADVYIDMISRKVVSIFTKKKLLMRAGETDKAVSLKDDRLFSLIKRFTEECGWTGQIDIDIFRSDGEYYISEVNPRFGGGYPFAYECGCNHMRMIVNNLNGIENEESIGLYKDGIIMMKYNEIMVRDSN